jgi:hypothetical protein
MVGWMTHMVSELKQAVRQFRLGMDGGGSASLVALIDELLKSMTGSGSTPLGPQVLPLLKMIIAGQQRGDFLYVADILEYEILPTIENRMDMQSE